MSLFDMSLKISSLKLQLHLLGISEFISYNWYGGDAFLWKTRIFIILDILIDIGPWGISLQSQISKSQTHFNDKFSVKLLSGECHNTSLIISQHWFR